MSASSFALRMVIVFFGGCFFSLLGAWLMTEKFDDPHELTGKVFGGTCVFIVAPLLLLWPYLPVTTDHPVIEVAEGDMRAICLALLVIQLIAALIFLGYHLGKKQKLLV